MQQGADDGARPCAVHSSPTTSDTLYTRIAVGGTHEIPRRALDYPWARAFYEELFAPDDMPSEPTPLLVDITHK